VAKSRLQPSAERQAVNSSPFLIAQSIGSPWQAVNQRFRQWTKPDDNTLVLSTILAVVTRSKSELVLENTLLRQQSIVLKQQIKHSKLTRRERGLFVASKPRTWKNALAIVQFDCLGQKSHPFAKRVMEQRDRRGAQDSNQRPVGYEFQF
jgi:hypothetical protein